MTLRRTALARRTELRRTPMTRAKRETKTRATRTAARQRDTGPSASVRRKVAERAGYSCEACGLILYAAGIQTWTSPHSFHHRRPRGMGGSSDPATNSPANLLLLCGTGTTGCHGLIEARRSWALEAGYLVPQGQDPAAVPVVVAPNLLVLLDHDGYYLEAS